jgi:NAD(P)-dependent dehydrogenase (short-subunit alcohol dehydrogenase family)
MSGRGVDVGVCYFGYIDTPMVEQGMSDPAAQLLRASLPGFIRRTHPAADAARAVADGMERRARVVCHPRWVRAMLAARGVIQPLVDRQGAADTAEAVRRSDEWRAAARSEAEAG